jgi:hypothetical protein
VKVGDLGPNSTDVRIGLSGQTVYLLSYRRRSAPWRNSFRFNL